MKVKLRIVSAGRKFYSVLLARTGRRDRRQILVRTPLCSSYLQAAMSGEMQAHERGWQVTSSSPMPAGYWSR